MAVGIADVEEEGVGDAVPAGPRSMLLRKPDEAITSQRCTMFIAVGTQ